MNLSPQMLKHKTLMIAVILIAQRIAHELGLELGAPLRGMCHQLGANRTSVYEQAERIVDAVEKLVAARPGRPTSPAEPQESTIIDAMRLTIAIQDYLLSHPGAVYCHAARTSYSPDFRRFVLDQLDRWPHSRERFADAALIPYDTLRDWIERDRAGIIEPTLAEPQLSIPVDASETTRRIAEAFAAWQGSTKAFLADARLRFALPAKHIVRVLRIIGAIRPRSRKSFRYRGSTQQLSPGAMTVTDGKTVDIELTGSGTRTTMNWQGMVDQTTGCDTAAIVTDEECAAAVRQAYDETVEFLGGTPPQGLLHDNKPCYSDTQLRQHVTDNGTILVAATEGRPENKAILEGSFHLFEERVGTITLDDTDRTSLIRSAVSEVIRAGTAICNAVPRPDLGGRSRLDVLRESCPSRQQQQDDLAFIRKLHEDHERQRRSDWKTRTKVVSRLLLDDIFGQRPELRGKDPRGNLREFLSIYEPAAIRQATAVFVAKAERGDLKPDHAHRYLTAIIQSKQEEIDLERAAEELLRLGRQEALIWHHLEQQEYEELRNSDDDELLACQLAERAAHGGLPIQGAFWTEKLTDLLREHHDLIDRTRIFLVRLYEAPPQRRLSLIDRITALEVELR